MWNNITTLSKIGKSFPKSGCQRVWAERLWDLLRSMVLPPYSHPLATIFQPLSHTSLHMYVYHLGNQNPHPLSAFLTLWPHPSYVPPPLAHMVKSPKFPPSPQNFLIFPHPSQISYKFKNTFKEIWIIRKIIFLCQNSFSILVLKLKQE